MAAQLLKTIYLNCLSNWEGIIIFTRELYGRDTNSDDRYSIHVCDVNVTTAPHRKWLIDRNGRLNALFSRGCDVDARRCVTTLTMVTPKPFLNSACRYHIRNMLFQNFNLDVDLFLYCVFVHRTINQFWIWIRNWSSPCAIDKCPRFHHWVNNHNNCINNLKQDVTRQLKIWCFIDQSIKTKHLACIKTQILVTSWALSPGRC